MHYIILDYHFVILLTNRGMANVHHTRFLPCSYATLTTETMFREFDRCYHVSLRKREMKCHYCGD